MKIAIDARALCRRRPAGKEKFTINILTEIFQLDKKNQYLLYLDQKYLSPLPSNFSQKIIKAPSLLWHPLVWLDLFFTKPDIFFAPLSYIIPAINFRCQNVIMIYDLAVFSLPNKLTNRKAAFIERIFLPQAIKRSQNIFTISHYVQREIKKLFKDSDNKISVIYPGIGSDFRIIHDQILKNAIIAKYKLPAKFILFVGTIEPRKNLLRLVEAYDQFINKYSLNDLSLILVGERGQDYQQLLEKIKKLNLTSKVIVLHYIPMADLPCLYNLATVFAFPSLDEGFGLPVLEAMACGSPVITSNISSLPEVAGSAAILINPDNVDEIAKALNKILANEGLRQELKQRGLDRAKNFSWQKTAREILKILSG